MAQKVKCKYCGESFDREIVPYEKIGTRYAHRNCTEQATEALAAQTDLKDYISRLFKDSADWKKIGAQTRTYVNQNYSYSGIKHTLEYFYVVKGENIKKANGGIGIVPYKYNEAREYYRREHNSFTTARKIKDGEIKATPRLASQIIFNKVQMEKKSNKLLPLDYGEDE